MIDAASAETGDEPQQERSGEHPARRPFSDASVHSDAFPSAGIRFRRDGSGTPVDRRARISIQSGYESPGDGRHGLHRPPPPRSPPVQGGRRDVRPRPGSPAARRAAGKGPGLRVLRGDLSPSRPLPSGLDVVFHLAGLTKCADANDYYTVNAEGTASLVRSLLGQGLRPRLVHLSSLAAGGPSAPGQGRPRGRSAAARFPLRREQAPGGGGSPEGLRRQDARVSVLRVAAVYGPGDEDFLAYFRYIEKGILPLLGRRPRYLEPLLRRRRRPGDGPLRAPRDERRGRSSTSRTRLRYSWEDLGRAAAEVLGKKLVRLRVPMRAFGSAAAISQAVSRVTGKPLPLNRSKYRDARQFGWVADVRKARDVLGFETRTPLAQGHPGDDRLVRPERQALNAGLSLLLDGRGPGREGHGEFRARLVAPALLGRAGEILDPSLQDVAAGLGVRGDGERDGDGLRQVEERPFGRFDDVDVEVRGREEVLGEGELGHRREIDDERGQGADEDPLADGELEDDLPLLSAGQPPWARRSIRSSGGSRPGAPTAGGQARTARAAAQGPGQETGSCRHRENLTPRGKKMQNPALHGAVPSL